MPTYQSPYRISETVLLLVSHISEQVALLLAHMASDSQQAYSITQLLQLLGLKHRPTFRKNYILPALEAKLITMTIPDSPKSPKQKYRLTAKSLNLDSSVNSAVIK